MYIKPMREAVVKVRFSPSQTSDTLNVMVVSVGMSNKSSSHVIKGFADHLEPFFQHWFTQPAVNEESGIIPRLDIDSVAS
jgi:hypothetical protein